MLSKSSLTISSPTPNPEKEDVMNWFTSKTNNLQKLYVIKALRSGMFSIAIIILFFKQHGLSMREITLLQSLFAIAVLLFEVPTGNYADNYGKKKSILIGGCFSVSGYVAYSLSSTFLGFLTGEILLAIGFCFVSGADSALIYDNTEQDQEGNQSFIKTEGNGGSASMFSEAITSFIGGSFLALVSLRFPIYFDVLLALTVFPVALSLHEPEKTEEEKQQQKEERESSITKMLRIMKYSLHGHVEIKWLIIYSAVVSTSTLTMVWFIQIYWMAAHVPIFMFGGLWATLMCVGALVSMRAHVIEKKLKRKRSLIALIVLPVIAYVLLGLHVAWWSVSFIALFYVVRGMNNPIMKSYINGLVSKKERATILSVQSLIGRWMFAIIGPCIGWVHDVYSLQIAFAVCAVLFATMGFIVLMFLHKNRLL
ncbi:MAG: Permease of the major facilitator superfamily [Candidatus Moranbacteria bacterium GW2011_GWD2_38_7]|nr:MAG: Permease of the major facilitator superfamily [Candidatus Moranbacteria bacterium GW2011_GWD2_38_7]